MSSLCARSTTRRSRPELLSLVESAWRRGSSSPPGLADDEGEAGVTQPAKVWREPLFSPGDRFPLGAPEGYPTDRYEDPSVAG
jgi:hypothetical protein